MPQHSSDGAAENSNRNQRHHYRPRENQPICHCCRRGLLGALLSPQKWGYATSPVNSSLLSPSPSPPFSSTFHPLPYHPFRSSALNRARWSGGSAISSPSGVRAEPRPPTHFCAISAQKMASCSAEKWGYSKLPVPL